MRPVVVWGVVALAVLAVVFLGRNTLKSITINNQDALMNPNVQAFLAMIRKFESAGRYNVLYGGGTFDSYAVHPHVRVPFFNPKTQKMDYSTAAGAYQITYPTWASILSLAGNGDFSPASQDAAAVWLLKMNGALDSIMQGDFNTALKLASRTWASLPFTDSMQRHVTIAAAQQIYEQSGGVIA